MLAIEKIERVTNLVVCVNNDGYEVDLELYEPYEVVPDDSLEPDDIRVIDETGDSYIYPANFFVTVEDLERQRFAF